jgi:hypothetical protein
VLTEGPSFLTALYNTAQAPQSLGVGIDALR